MKATTKSVTITTLLIVPTLVLVVAIMTAKRGPKILPPTGIQKERIDAWKRQPFVTLTNGRPTRDIVAAFRFQCDAPRSSEEMEALTNSVVGFVDAFRVGTFDAYKTFRVPVGSYSFEQNFGKAVAKNNGISATGLVAEKEAAWRHYWDSVIGNRYVNYWVGISPTNCEVVIEQTSSPSNDLRYAITQGSPEFTFESIVDLPLLANGLCRPTSQQSLADYVFFHLPSNARRYLEQYQGGMDVAGQKEVVAGLNSMIESGPIYSSDLFSDVKLSSDTEQLLARNPKGKDLVRLNRLLLVDAFPGALCRRAMVDNVGISFMRPTIELKPSRSEVLQAQGTTDIATVRILPERRLGRPIFPIYLRLYWSRSNKAWLPEQLIAAYSRPDRNGDLFF